MRTQVDEHAQRGECGADADRRHRRDSRAPWAAPTGRPSATGRPRPVHRVRSPRHGSPGSGRAFAGGSFSARPARGGRSASRRPRPPARARPRCAVPARPGPGPAISSSATSRSVNLRAVTSTRASSDGHRLVVAGDRRVEAAAELGHVGAHRGQAAVQLLAELVDLGGVARQRLLPPAVGDGAQQRDERGGCGDHDVVRERVLQQRRDRTAARPRGTGRPARTARRTPATARTPPSSSWPTSASTCWRSCRACAASRSRCTSGSRLSTASR